MTLSAHLLCILAHVPFGSDLILFQDVAVHNVQLLNEKDVPSVRSLDLDPEFVATALELKLRQEVQVQVNVNFRGSLQLPEIGGQLLFPLPDCLPKLSEELDGMLEFELVCCFSFRVCVMLMEWYFGSRKGWCFCFKLYIICASFVRQLYGMPSSVMRHLDGTWFRCSAPLRHLVLSRLLRHLFSGSVM